MKTQKTKFTAIFSATLFLTAIFFALAANASAQKLKPGEIIYSRRASVNSLGCVDSSIWTMGADGSNDRLLFTNGLHPRISPDGRFLLFKRFLPQFGCGPNCGGASFLHLRLFFLTAVGTYYRKFYSSPDCLTIWNTQ